MTMPTDEQQRIKENLVMIRSYLEIKFPDYVITEQSDLSVGYTFVVTDKKRYKQYMLWVDGARLSDKCYSPDRTKDALDKEEIAWKMTQADEDGFFW